MRAPDAFHAGWAVDGDDKTATIESVEPFKMAPTSQERLRLGTGFCFLVQKPSAIPDNVQNVDYRRAKRSKKLYGPALHCYWEAVA